MEESDRDFGLTGTGPTPRAAVEDVAPTTDDDVARILGIEVLDRKNPDADDVIRHPITIYYSSKPAMQWICSIWYEDAEWVAFAKAREEIG